LWWTTYENPNLWKNRMYNTVENLAQSLGLAKNKMEFRQRNQKILNYLTKNASKKWINYLISILKEEKDIDVILVLTVPLNQFVGVPTIIKKEFNIPIVFYDGDTPTSLPSHGGLSFSFYNGADPSEYDAFIIQSKGAAEEVKNLGAKKVFTVYWGADPAVFSPMTGIKPKYDVGFYGIGSKLREEWIKRLLVDPAEKPGVSGENKGKFAICGRAFDMNLGSVQLVDADDISYRRFSCQTKINLNIVRKPHATVYASATSRIFELASMGCCIVSNPYNGIEEWFSDGKEVLVAKDGEEISELYKWLLSDDEERLRLGNAARQRLLQEHTFAHRARQIQKIFETL
jgi:spore maturation protein CgeB